MSFRKPQILRVSEDRACCPVCGHPSYSPSGVHPQCAVARADAVLKAERKAELAAAQAVAPPPSSQTCPRCRRRIRSRRMACDCGYRFPSAEC